MKINLKLKLESIYGGDGFTRYEEKKIPKFSRRKIKKTKRSDVGVEIDRKTREITYDIVDKEINSFKTNNNGDYFLRLGGIHGKFWGLLKESGEFLKEMGDTDFPSFARLNRLIKMINIKPIWVKLENPTNLKEEKIQQILNSPGKPMIIQHFDVIENCEVNIILLFPDVLEKQVKKLLRQSEGMYFGNKRRGSFEILNKKEIFK